MKNLLKSCGPLEIALTLTTVSLISHLAWPAFDAWINRPCAGKQVTQRDDAYPYLIYLPETSRSTHAGKTLLLFLHGSGSRGSDLNPQRLGGPAKLLDDKKELPMIVVSPQCPIGATWDVQRLVQLLESLQARFQPERVVVTGYSMGGSGTWALAQAHPELIDAAAPVCGCGDPAQAGRLKGMPVWTLHGEFDDVVSVECSREMIEAINAIGGTATATIFPDQGHGISRLVYEDPRLYMWLLNPRRSSDGIGPP